MKSCLLILFLITDILYGYAQLSDSDYSWWNHQHGWQEGDPGWRNWIKITPGYLGPNALPVPHVQKGELRRTAEFELAASNHFHKGDPTRDVSGYFYYPFAGNQVAIEMYGVAVEQFTFSNEIRNERFARIEDGKGFAIGDFYFSTLIQIVHDKTFPNTLFRFATRTASGNQLEGARYTDSPGYFFDFSFSKNLGQELTGLLRPFGMLGFYSWQTNDELNLQNDALLYAMGLDYKKSNWLVSGSWSGYSGYKNERDKPMQINFDLRKDFSNKAIRFQYHHGIRHWNYKTTRVSFIWKFKHNKTE